MLSLTPEESRVLGVLIEKATTTPEQYPLSLNALTNGSNQKSNRDPVLTLTEDQVFDAVEKLREKQLAVRVDTVGSRVHKYKHIAGETLRCRAGELAVLAELLTRGPQTIGELRGRASRMTPMATLDDAKVMLRALMEREEPLAREVAPAPGSRAERFAQLLCPDLHPVEERVGGATLRSATPPASQAGQGTANQTANQASSRPDLSARVTQLEEEVQSLRTAIRKLATAVGEADPLLESQANSGIAQNPATSED